MNTKKIMRSFLVLLFCVYCVFLINFLFLDARLTTLTYAEHLKRSVNLVPFKTIAEYVSKIANKTINLSSFLKNMFGNLILFLPMGLFLPCLSNKMRKFSKALVVNLIIILAVECIQLFSTLGSFDIDDVIFNMFGSTAGHAVFQCKPINVLLKRMQIA